MIKIISVKVIPLDLTLLIFRFIEPLLNGLKVK